MVAIIKRMRKLRQLLNVRTGPGAAILPPEVMRLHMEFAVRQEKGHTGARVFWRKHLRRLKYHNPAIPMTVSRSKDQSTGGFLTIHFTSSSASSTPPAVTSTITAQRSTAPVTETTSGPSTERTEVIPMKHRTESQILDRLMALTKAKEVLPTEDELRQIRELQEFRVRAEADAKRQNAYLSKIKKEKDIMDRARAMADV